MDVSRASPRRPETAARADSEESPPMHSQLHTMLFIAFTASTPH